MILWRGRFEPASLIAEIEASARAHAAELGKPSIDSRVLEAMSHVPRDRFVPEVFRDEAFCNEPLPIGHGQTISSPFIVAVMTDALEVDRNDRILEIGTGSGYQAAVLAELAAEVFSVEVVPDLGRTAARRLRELGYRNVEVRIGDGNRGWPEHAPYDGIIVTACAERIPPALTDQLKVGGRLIAPLRGQRLQWLTLVERASEVDYRAQTLIPVQFVPLVEEVFAGVTGAGPRIR